MEVPVAASFGALSGFDEFEREARKSGVEVVRLDSLSEPGVGMAWRICFIWRGKQRTLEAQLAEFEAPDTMRFTAESDGFMIDCGLALVALSRKQTRLHVDLDLRPKTLASRLVIQSMKLGKTSLSKRFGKRVQAQARDLEIRYQRGEI